jgi:membrane associated rhomboid family serine protease
MRTAIAGDRIPSMGIYDRDYYRNSDRQSGFGSFQPWTITVWLIVINVIVFVLDQLSDHMLTGLGYFSLDTAVFHWQVWRFVTFQFLHASASHIFWNMLGLYFFGPLVEMALGARRYVAFYLLSGVGGALGYLAIYYSGILRLSPDSGLVGASAGIFGVLIAAALIAPDSTVMLMFPPIPMKLRTMAWIYLGFAAYVVVFNRGNAGGEASHLGGALIGFLLIKNPWVLDWFDFRGRSSKMYYRGRRIHNWRNDRNR